MEDAIKSAMGFLWMEKLSITEGETVNQNFVVNTDKGKYFIKWNNITNSKEIFDVEYYGLKLLQTLNVIRTPEVYLVGQVSGGSDTAFIILEYWEDLQPLTTCTAHFAHALAQLHNHNPTAISMSTQAIDGRPVTKFGSEKKVFFGPHFYIPENTWYDRWDEYFVKEMMEPQLSFSEKNLKDEELSSAWDTLKPNINCFFQTIEVLPSLCIGDVGSDNSGQVENQPVLFDPYCFYGHYEFDLTQPYLTNDFSPEFYRAYFDSMPKQDGYENRKYLYRLFGCLIRHNYGMDGYLEKAKNTLKVLNQLVLEDSERYSTFSSLYMYSQPAAGTVIHLTEDGDLEMTNNQRPQGFLACQWT